ASAPYQGPNRIAIGSVTTRPSRSGAAEPMRHWLRSIPVMPHSTARPRRFATRVIVSDPAPASAGAPIVYSPVMRVVIPEEDRVTGEILSRTLRRWNHDTTLVGDGLEAWERLRTTTEPTLAILDWMMPGMDGPDVCRRVRTELPLANMYLLLVTARESRGDVV